MTLDYFYGAQVDQFAFYRIPKALFTDERFKSISAEAKICRMIRPAKSTCAWITSTASGTKVRQTN